MAFFGKTDAPPPPSNPNPSAPPPERTASPSLATPSPATAATVIGPRVKFVGDVSGDEDILINGRLEGKIRVDRRVVVASGAEIEGDVAAKSVVIGGRVHGQVMASERAELLPTGRVQGNVQSPRIVMAEGAQIQGRVIMPAEGSARPLSAPPRVEAPPKTETALRLDEPARRPLVPPKPEEPARRPVSPSGTGG